MTMPVNLAGLPLPVTPPLLTLLGETFTHTGQNLTRMTALTFHFRNPTYSPTTGGVHPVEIRLIRQAGCWLFDYVTDFSYQGHGQDAELCKELDFNFLDNEHYLQGWGPLPMAEAQELFTLWQHNFLAYAQLGFFTVTVSGD
ncbi:hypothetical protein HNP12_004542 [Aeromonas hydrophila]|uniref:DUF2787 domain-containing protein n=1 Tax=Aeromonas hydrophila TaxID=644 RepID=UPI002167CF1F|nr:DUF2787 domain-containing protein [Aeromonas hydrophila]MCS3770402.1 hypothetical protein [Aeromonas hydrophila]MCS3793665.1 hypothetical protein [Aeromonas hydrophila]